MEKNRLTAIILAAGQGTRMKSPLPKVLHPVAGQPMIARVISMVKTLQAAEVRVVVGHGKALVEKVIVPMGALPFEQKEQKGTAHAVMAADFESLQGEVLILNGDHPLITKDDLLQAIAEFRDGRSDLAVLTCVLREPGDFGRIVRQNGDLKAIVEAKDASGDTLKITEVNTGAYLVKATVLKEYLPQIKPQNAQKEFYLTDLVSLCVENSRKTVGIKMSKRFAFGVNDQMQLARATKSILKNKTDSLMKNGVIFIRPETCYIEDDVQIGAGSVIYPNVFIKGPTQIGSFCVIEPNCFIMQSQVADGVQIKMGSHIDQTSIATKAQVGPYARLRPETEIGEDARVGNFVEMKKTKFGSGAKANHLAYLGDATIGEGTNIGCGTITCNLGPDHKKHPTHIGKNVFVGSDSQFVAPVTIGDNAVIGAGSTITKDVPAKALAVTRAKQITIENYFEKKKG